MEYRFYSSDDEMLVAHSELPTDSGIAVALRSTGYDTDSDEALELAIVDFDGKTLFAKKVKPQNTEQWTPSEATGGITPADVEDAPELYQFEEEVSEIFGKAAVVLADHLAFVNAMIEGSWVTLPDYDGTDLEKLFCASHCNAAYPDEQATVASLEDIASYYGIDFDASSTEGTATCIVKCYRAIVKENADEREARGPEYWAERDRRVAAEAEKQAAIDANVAQREHRLNQINGMMWVCGGLIFVSLAIQVYQRGMDLSIMIVLIAAAVFAFSRAVISFRK